MKVDLENLLDESGPYILELSSGFRLHRSLSNIDPTTTSDKIKKRIAYQFELLGLVYRNFQLGRDSFPHSINMPVPTPTELAFHLISHNAGNKGRVVVEIANLMQEDIRTGERVRDLDWRNTYFGKETIYALFENVRYMCAMLPRIGGRGSEYVLPIPTIKVPLLTEILLNQPFSFASSLKSIDSDVYISMAQLLTNASKVITRSEHPRLTEDDVFARVSKNSNYTICTVKDTGSGIHPEHLPLLFGSFTTGGTGIGLQLVKRILELRGGFAEVVTSQGNGTFQYDTRSNAVQSVPAQREKGTTFSLYFPKV